MLPLDDPAWSQLTHAYGSAGDIPPMLIRLRTDPSPAVWEALWSALCHQHDVSLATYAALPHLVAMAGDQLPNKRGEYLNFIAMAIACASLAAQPRITPALAPAYGAAVAATRAHALESMSDLTLPQSDLPVAAAALAAARGDAATAFDFMNAGEALSCPVCASRVPPWGEHLTT
jgi:hypothetical protein